MKIAYLIVSFLSLAISINTYANEEQERIYLIQIINQLHAIKPLVIAAAREQPRLNRIQFHYAAYKDAEGKSHPGLLEDLKTIENGIQEKLNHLAIEPRTVAALQGDYINQGKASEASV